MVLQLEEGVMWQHGVKEEGRRSWQVREVVEMGTGKVREMETVLWLTPLRCHSKKAYQAMAVLLPFAP